MIPASNPIRWLKIPTFALISTLTLAIVGCGGGGGGGVSLENEPAPQTFNGIVLRLSPNIGPVLTFVASQGNAVTGTEFGAVTMAANPVNFQGIDSGGNSIPYVISNTISGVTYAYTRTAPESGRLVISGEGQTGVIVDEGTINYFEGNFSRTYEILFATNGNTITAIATQDYDTALGPPQLTWSDGRLTLVNGAQVPVGWDLNDSLSLDLPKIYPEGISQETLVITELGQDDLRFLFLESTFTRFSSNAGDFIEKGVGNLFIGANPIPETVNFEYAPNPSTTNIATIRIFREFEPDRIFTFTFFNFEEGDFIDNSARVGEFEFPFLE
jgi:hypothetical protein